jgi:hypothetical protein
MILLALLKKILFTLLVFRLFLLYKNTVNYLEFFLISFFSSLLKVKSLYFIFNFFFIFSVLLFLGMDKSTIIIFMQAETHTMSITFNFSD